MRIGGLDLVRLVEQAQRIEDFEEAIAAAARGLPADAGSIIDFLEVPTGDAFDVPPAQALAYFKAKGLKTTFSYADMLDYQHDQAFTVAKMLNVDMLGQVRASLDAALNTGQTFKEWADTITPVLQSGGWWGRKAVVDPLTGQEIVAQLGSPWRLETIFRTNMQTAYAAGAWQEIEAQKDLAPFLMYDAVDDLRTRPLHASWDQKVLPVDSDWWKTHYPPNGYNCRCGVIQLSAAEVEALGLQPQADPPDDGTFKWTNPRTGDVVDIPRGLDPGFEHNAGVLQAMKAKLAKLEAEKIANLQADMRAAAKRAQQLAKENIDTQLAAATAAQADAAAAQAKAALERAKAIAAEKSKQWVAQQQIDAIAKGKDSAGAGAAYKIKALAELKKGADWPTLRPAEQLEQVLALAVDLKKKADLSKALSLYKSQILAGKNPSPAAAKAFKGFEADDPAGAAAWLKKVDDEKAAIAAKKAAEEAAAAKKAADDAAAAAASAQPTVPAVAPAVVRGTAPNPATMAKIGEQKGSNPGGTYQDTDTGIKWYVKQPASEDIARNEVLAAKLYELAGIDVPELHLITLNGKPSIASRIVDGLTKGDARTLAGAPGAADGFAVDAWLANWDVVGLSFDNLLMRGGRAFRVDTGGALRYRAQGGLKGSAFGDSVAELESLRDASLNRQSADVFGRLTAQQIEDSAVAVLRVKDRDIEFLVEEFGPRDVRERAALAERLIARRDDLARRFPAAAARARQIDGGGAEPPKVARVTAAEQQAVEASRVNGYGFATDSDQIEDNMVLVHAFKRATGADATRGFFKLLPGASAELAKRIGEGLGNLPTVNLTATKAKILETVKSINFRADKGQPLDEKVTERIRESLHMLGKDLPELRAAASKTPNPAAIVKAIDELEQWQELLGRELPRAQSKQKAVKLGKLFDAGAIADELEYGAKKASSGGLKWKKVSAQFVPNTSKFDRSFATETSQQQLVHGVNLRYEAELDDGTKITYFPHDDGKVAWTMQGVVQIDVPGRGLPSTERIFGAIEEAGLKAQRATEVDRQHLYLNAFARLRLLRDPVGRAAFESIKDRGADGVRAKLAALKKSTGVDVEKSEGWKSVDGVRQAFGHGRAYQHRPDLTAAELEAFNRTHVIYHNTDGLSWDAGSGVFEKLKMIIEGGGMFASLSDRVRRGVPLNGSSVSSDLASGGGDYHFTRLGTRGNAKGTGVYWRTTVLRRMDAITYRDDQFGRTTGDNVEKNRYGQDLASLRSVAYGSGGGSSNETIFKGGLSLFDDLDRIVLSSEAEVKAAVAWLQSKGYRTWPDGRKLEEVIMTKAKHAKP